MPRITDTILKGGTILDGTVRRAGNRIRVSAQLIRVADRIAPAGLVAALHERRFIVKGPFSTPGLEDCIRVTLGPPALMEHFADVLEEVLA